MTKLEFQYAEPDANGVVAVSVIKEYQITITPVVHPGDDLFPPLTEWIVSSNGRTLATWSSLEMAKKNLAGMIL